MTARYGTFEDALADRYRFEEELGRGAMGIVYRAKDLRLGRPVAIKMLHPALTNELGVARFQSEIRIAASLHHPNIIAVHESGEIDGRLFYVMNYLGGETLRARLQREKQLSVEDALSIVEGVADGLQYAHDHGVVHRDVKPENILLADGRACVMDFGLARALDDADAERLTASGLAVGTPHYLSPEQASAEKEVGPRADQYALACVLYEMLVGEPPFTGPTASSIAMRHISEAPPAMRTRRKTTSVSVEAAVMKAMEKVPADRFGSVRDFVRACLTSPVGLAVRGDSARTRRNWRIAVIASLGLVPAASLIAAVATSDSAALAAITDGVRFVTGNTLDTTKFVIFPASQGVGVSAAQTLDQQLANAFSRWSEINVPSAVEIREAAQRPSFTPATPAEASAVARRMKAGRFVLSEVSFDGKTVRISSGLFDATGKRQPRRAAVSFVAGRGAPDSVFSHLALALLFGPDVGNQYADAAKGTRNRVAFGGYLRARKAMADWNLNVADTVLSAVSRADPGFPQASLALATVRMWARDASPEVGRLATKALENSTLLSPSDRLRAGALRDFSNERWGAACAAYDSLLATDSLDFEAWYGSAECNRKDDIVVPSRSSPSGRAFRASRQRAVIAIDRAFDLLTTVDSCCTARAAMVQRRHFYFMSTTSVRYGRGSAADTTTYSAYPELIDDTLAFIPYPVALLGRSPNPTHASAVEQQRQAFLRLATKRLALTPNSADALELLGEAMELKGDVAAVDTVRRARGLALSPSQILRLAGTEAWLRVKFAIPGNVSELVAMRVFAESLITHSAVSSAKDATVLASLSSLIGDGPKAAMLAARIDRETLEPGVPEDVKSAANAMIVYAAGGGPADSLRELETRLTNGIASGVLPAQQPMYRTMFLGRAAALALPVYRASAFGTLDTVGMPLIAAELAREKGDNRKAHAILAAPDRARARMRAADLTLDVLYPEAWLLASMGDTAAAERRIGRTLDAIQRMPVRQFNDAVIAGSLIQSMSLRAQLLVALGERDAGRRWARAVVALTDTTSAAARQARTASQALAR